MCTEREPITTKPPIVAESPCDGHAMVTSTARNEDRGMGYNDWDNLPPGVTPRDIDEAAGVYDDDDEYESERWCDGCGLELWSDEETLCADCARQLSGGDKEVDAK